MIRFEKSNPNNNVKVNNNGGKRMFRCEYCGKEYPTVSERTKCESDCERKAKEYVLKKEAEEKEQVKQNKVDYVNGLWKKVEDARKLAQKSEDELHKEYPYVAVAKPSGVANDTDSTFNVIINGKHIDDEKVISELKKLFVKSETKYEPFNWFDSIFRF